MYSKRVWSEVNKTVLNTPKYYYYNFFFAYRAALKLQQKNTDVLIVGMGNC